MKKTDFSMATSLYQGRALAVAAVAAVAPCGFASPSCGAGASPDAHGGERGGAWRKKGVLGIAWKGLFKGQKQGCNQQKNMVISLKNGTSKVRIGI